MKDLTKGTPARIMISFAVPVALGNMFQLCYSLADTRVVGSALGETALAAVGATASISTLFIGFLSGLTNGFSLLIAREFGAGNKEGVKRFAAGSLLLCPAGCRRYNSPSAVSDFCSCIKCGFRSGFYHVLWLGHRRSRLCYGSVPGGGGLLKPDLYVLQIPDLPLLPG